MNNEFLVHVRESLEELLDKAFYLTHYLSYSKLECSSRIPCGGEYPGPLEMTESSK